MNFVLNEKLKVVITTLHHKSHFESDFSLEKGCLETLRLKGKETVHIPWMNEMSDHQRSLLEQKETQHQLNTALCPGKDKGMIFKNIMAHC